MEELSNTTPPNTFSLPEFPFPNPDPFFKDYDHFLKNHTPIVIDNGSYECRAGYVGEMNPRLSFRSLIAKVRTRTAGINETRIYVGNDIKDSEIVKLGARSPFDQNLVYSFDWQENVFDHVFSRLGIESDKVDNPILMTEPICNPTYCRKNMSEMLFECYRVQSVCYGIDSLFSLYHNAPILPKHSLIVSSGYTCTHLVPVNEYYFNPTNCKRLNVGGFHSSELMRKVLSLKYSFHKNFITPTRAQLLKEQHCYFAENYTEELAKYSDRSPSSSTHIIQLPFVEQMSAAKLEEERLRKIQTRKEQGQRLKEYSERKRRDKLAGQEERLANLKDILNSVRDKDNLEGFDRLEMEGFGDEDELVASITEIEDQVKKTKKRMGLGGDEKEEEEEDQEQPEPENLYPLLEIPDDQLNDVQKKEKRKQRFLKNMRDGRVQQQKKKKLEEEKKIAAQKAEEERRLANPEEFIGELRSKRKALLERKEQRTKIRAQLQSNSGRRTAADRQRLRLLTQLESGETKKRKTTSTGQNDDDNFGANDEDWQIYLAVAGDQQFKEEEEDEDAQLLQIDNLLAKHDPEFQATTTTIPSSTSPLVGMTENVPSTAADYQIYLGVERIRIPELLYQPPIIGVEQMGLSESMIHTLMRYPKEIQEEMVMNIFCTGGNVSYPGFLTRLENEVRMLRPFKSPFKISLARDPVYDTWRGMSEWVTNNFEEFTQVSITKKEYDEMGPNYLKRFFASNISLPSPK